MRNLWTKIKKCLQAEMLQKMWKEFLWIAQYARRYWKAMIFYTALGVFGTGVSLASSVISKDLVDIITGHQTGKLLQTFALMIGFSFGNTLISQASAYASTMINLKVDREIQNDIFAKILVTDWESLTAYHTGDLVTRWSSDASNISSGILNWLPNLVIYTVKFISALAIVVHYDPTFAIFALLGIPFSALLSRPLLRRMTNNNQRSAQMSAKLYGFNQEAFSNIQTIKAFDMIRFYVDRLKNLQQDACQKGHGAQQGYPAGGVSCGLEWCKQEQLLPGQLPDCPRLSSAQEEVHGAVPQPRLYLLWIGTEQGGDIPAVAGQHHLPQTVAAGEQVVQIPVQEGLDAPLPPARVHSSPKAIQTRLSPAVSTPGSRPATQPYQLPDGGVH